MKPFGWTPSSLLGLALALTVTLSSLPGCAGRTPPLAAEETSTSTPAPTQAVTDIKIKPRPPLDDEGRLKETKATYYYLVGEMLLREHAWPMAEEAFQRAAEDDPEAAEPRFLVAQLATRRGDLRKAATYCQEVVALDPKHMESRLLLASIFASTREDPKAAEQYEALLALDADNNEARLMLAQVHGRMKNFDRARKTLEPILEDPQDGWKANVALGRAYVNGGVVADALKPFRRARELAPGELEPVLALGSLLQELNQLPEAETLFRDYLTEHPENIIVHTHLGRLLLDRDDRGAALDEFRTITRITPDSVQARLTTVIILLSQESYDEALRELRLAEAVDPNHHGVRFYLGRTLESLGKADDAATEYQRITENSTFFLDSQLRLSFLEAERGELSQSVARIRGLLAKHPERPDLFLALSFLQLQQKDYTGVITTVDKGLILDPKQVRFLFNRAMALDKLDRWDEAEKDLRAYLGQNPDDAHALNYLGYTWADRGEKLEEALTMLKKATELEPLDGFITDSLGWVYYRLHRFQEALETLRKAISLEPRDPTINEHLGDVHWAMGQRQEALDTWRHALELDPKNDKLRDKLRRHAPSP